MTVPLLAGLALASCRSTEEELVDRFLSASAREDNQTVAALSMMVFPDPLADWQVLTIGPVRSEPYLVPELRERVKAAENERDAQFREFGDFRQKNYDDLARIQRRLSEDPDAQFSGQLGELRAQWDAYRDSRREVVAKLRDAELDLEREIRRVEKSLQRDARPEYLTGETLHEDVVVRVENAQSQNTEYVVELTRYELRNQFDAVIPSRWIISRVEREPPGP